jgi:hypothetical protein
MLLRSICVVLIAALGIVSRADAADGQFTAVLSACVPGPGATSPIAFACADCLDSILVREQRAS